MFYYAAPWEWVQDEYTPGGVWEPADLASAVGWIDLTPGERTTGSTAGAMLLASSSPRTDGDLLGIGDIRQLKPGGKEKAIWKARFNQPAPQGETLAEWVMGLLEDGDPEGQDRCRPIVPTKRSVELWLPGHGSAPCHSKKFVWGRGHTNRLRDTLRRSVLTQIEAGDNDHVRRYLDDLEKTYPGLQWRDVVPDGWDLPPMPRATSYSETFTAADATAITALTQTWAAYGTGAIVVQSNQASQSLVNKTSWAVLQLDVSSNDNWGDLTITQRSSSNPQSGPSCRNASASAQGYYVRELTTGFGHRLERINSSLTATLLASYTTTLAAANDTVRCKASGSTITGDRPINTNRTSVTDTTYATGTRGGIYLFCANATTRERIDGFSVDDGVSVSRPQAFF